MNDGMTQPEQRLSKPVIAVVLSLVTTGLGHVYLGQAKRGILIFLIFAGALGLLSTLGIKIFAGKVIFVAVGLDLLVKILVSFDVLRIIRRGEVSALKAYNRWYVYLALFLIANVIVKMREIGEKNFSIPTQSMEETVLAGDRIMVDMTAYHLNVPLVGPVFSFGTPLRGDIVVFKWPRDKKTTYLSRVVGLPGEEVRCAGLGIEGDGKALSEPYINLSRSIKKPNCDAILLQENEYFLVGDNRGNSADSRTYGPVSIENISGRAGGISWSFDDVNKTVRWARTASDLK